MAWFSAATLGVPISHFWGMEMVEQTATPDAVNPDQYVELRNRLIGGVLRQARDDAGLTQEQLALALFPVGDLEKTAVRQLARERDLPVADLLRIHGGPPSDYEDVATRPASDPYWDYLGGVTPVDRFDVPALHVNSWYDPTPNSTLALFNAMQRNAVSERGRDHQLLLMSPSGHCESEQLRWPTRVGRRWLGDARFDYWGLYVRWFDHWLKGDDNGVTDEPRVRLYVMGRDEWRAESEWPLARTRFTPYYLTGEGHANTLDGDGILDAQDDIGKRGNYFEGYTDGIRMLFSIPERFLDNTVQIDFRVKRK